MRKQNLFGRFLATFLAVVMVLSCVPVSVFATQTDEVPAFAEEQTTEPVETPVVESTEAEEEEETQAPVMQVNEVDPQDDEPEDPSEGENSETPAAVEADIATVLASEDTTTVYKVKGVVTFVDSKIVYMQDASGSMVANFDTKPEGVAKGNTVVVICTKKDATSVTATALEASEGMTLTAQKVTVSQLANMIGSYVELEDLEVVSTSGTASALTVNLKDSTGSISLYRPVLAADVTLNPGDEISLKATVGAYNGKAQLRTSEASELTVTYQAPIEVENETAVLVKDVTKLAVGDSILLVATDSEKAMSTVQGSNNRGTVAITKDGDSLTFNKKAPTPAQIITLEAGTKEGTFAFHVDNGYLYAVSSKSNHLKTETTLSDNSSWLITIDEDGVASIIAQGTNTRNVMQYNKTSDIFSCYGSASQQKVSIYKIDDSEPEPDPVPERTSGIVTDLTALQDGDTVVIFNPANSMALSSTYKGYYNQGTSVTLADGKLTYGAADLWTLGINADGTYSFSTTGGKLSMDTGFTSTPLGKVNDSWKLTVADAEAGTYYISNVGRDGYVLEYQSGYTTWSAYNLNTTGAEFQQQLYLVVEEQGGSTEPTPEPEEPTTVTIATALAGENGTSFTVKGVVTFTDGQNIYLQDATGGICLRLSGSDSTVALGDTLIATGSKSVYNGLTQLSGTYVKSSGLELKAKEITAIADLTNADICTYVELKGVEVTEIYDGNGTYSSPNITVKDSNGTTIQLYKAVVTKKEDGSWPYAVGDKLDIKAAIGYFNKFQLRNTLESEVTLAGSGSTTTDKVADGKYVIWVGGDYNMALSSNYSGYYNNGVAVTMDGGVLSGYTAAEIWTVTNQEDGTITLSYGGQNLGMADSYSSMTLGGKNDAWALEDAGNGKWYLKNIARGLYAQWYAANKNWSGYYIDEGTEDRFALTFTPAEDVIATDSTIKQAIAQWGGMLNGGETGHVNGDRYKVGDQMDANADYTAVVGGKTVTPYTVGGTTEAPLYYMGGAGFGSGSNDYMQMAVNTAGWADMSLTFRLRVSGGGPASFQLCYSADNGTTWNNFTTGSYDFSYTIYNSEGSDSYTKNGTITDGIAQAGMGYQGGKSNYVTFTFDVPKGAANCENLLIRLVSGTTKANGKDGLPGNTATTRFDNIVLTGSPIVSDGITGYVTVAPDGSEDQAVGTELTMTSTTEGATIYYRVNGGDWQTYSEENKPTLASLPCDVEAYAKCEGKQDSVVRLYHYAAGTVGTVKMTPNGGSVWVPSEDEPVSIQLSTTTEGATIYYVVADDNGVYPVDGEGNVAWTVYSEETPITLAKGFGSMKMKAYAAKTGFTDSAVNEKTFTERATEEFNIYFGQLHSHTNISDGSGSITEAYSHGYSLETLDFLAVTDHSNSFDNTDNGDLNTDGTTVSTEWAEAKAAAKAITDETFVGLYGYEMTWSNGLGHMNTYNTAGWQSRTQTDYKTYATALENYYTKLETAPDSISQFNHPGTTFGDFQDFAYYSEARDQLITLIEVGNGEGEIGSSGYFPSYEYYTRALDKGWHVAPTNNQDNHKGRWGSANTARSVVLADSLTESAIYDAMRNYRVYATEDNDLNIYYTLDGNIMGSILSASDVGENVELNVLLSDATDKLAGTKVQVIVNGGLVAASTTIAESKARTIDWQEEVTFTVPSSYNYYYIKITQPDGDIAVTAPVWVGDMESVGISSFTTDAALPVKDQEMNLTLELYNNVKKELEIQSIVFQLGDSEDAEIIHTADLTDLKSVPAMGTASYSFAYTHNTVGKTQIYAVVTGTLNGQQRIYKEKLELTFVPSEMVTRVIVDGTHYNDYVTGYYGGNINNLTTIAAESQIEVSIVKDEITADMLENCQLLIISAPAKKAGTANAGDYVAKPFEDSFLNLVKDYVTKGGSVIVCGLADYQDKGADSADYHAAAQLNKLLSTIGSTMRIGDDEVYDEVNNGGQAYRLYPTTFNMDSKWCAGIVDGQQYSQYSGCTVDPGQGTWLVKGFDTTYSIDSDGDGLGGVEKGNAVFLAAEDTSYGGTIFAAGGVFVSDFEVKAELDNIWDLPYANRTIVENILGAVRTELPLSTIAQVRAGEMGQFFRTKGYVTAGTDNEYNKFFDAIYLQDDTAGITVFPFAELGVALGTPIEVVGYVDAYQGDKEIQITSYKILDEESKVIEPTKLSAKEAMDYDTNGGKLIQVEGTVVEVEYDSEKTGVSQLVVQDGNGDKAKVFIDGYILSGTTGKNELASTVKLGATVSAVGLLYMHPEGDSDVSIPVLRVRNCDEVIATSAGTDVTVQHSVDVIIVGEGGTASVDKTTAKKGETVTVTTKAEDGYGVKSVVVNGGDVKVTKKSGKYTFTMPDGDVEVKVTFEETYNVFIKDSKYGTITVSDETPFAGDTVTITIKPVSGKQVNSVKVVDEDGNRVKVTSKNGKWTFTMPESDVTVSATFEQASSKTGDTSHVYLYVGIMVVAILALVVLILGRKKWFKK